MTYVAFDSGRFLHHPLLVAEEGPVRESGTVVVYGDSRIETTFAPLRTTAEDGQAFAGIRRERWRVPVFEGPPITPRVHVGYIAVVTLDDVTHHGRELVSTETEFYDKMVQIARAALREAQAGRKEKVAMLSKKFNEVMA